MLMEFKGREDIESDKAEDGGVDVWVAMSRWKNSVGSEIVDELSESSRDFR